MTFTCVTARDRPDLAPEVAAAFRQRWPEFVFHDPVVPRYLDRVGRYFRTFDVLLLDGGRPVAGGWGVPFTWNQTVEDLPEGYDGALARSVEDHEAGRPADTFSLMAAAVHPEHDGRGLATEVIAALTARAAEAGLRHVIAPLRPTWKHRYPNVGMAEYATWVRDDGLSVDPWIRTHQRLGARILAPAPNSMVIPGTVREWEQWADMPFPVSGEYVVPGALNLVTVDRERDEAVYREENLWVRHRDPV
ncbi:hypothetical protein LX16_5071 [Stackebrandtia albiflava]|uniref:N-acetyltransferase domain-containing protein n=1 Tax=Stackebrandtia albiflava TaxID=406432 RepID=A0A562UPN7_9ACTN|nr:GNAT family N-acetyltransferase [Stackebrandtia albiflava]TWJ07585.1 hypothetical protein LX16_5071 [Stackebrandtia albiflava]